MFILFILSSCLLLLLAGRWLTSVSRLSPPMWIFVRSRRHRTHHRYRVLEQPARAEAVTRRVADTSTAVARRGKIPVDQLREESIRPVRMDALA